MEFLKKMMRKLVINGLIKNFEMWLSKLPLNEQKTVTGLTLTILGVALQEMPNRAPYLQPAIDALHTLPADQLTGAGLLLAVIGLIHKFAKVFGRSVPVASVAPGGPLEPVVPSVPVMGDAIRTDPPMAGSDGGDPK